MSEKYKVVAKGRWTGTFYVARAGDKVREDTLVSGYYKGKWTKWLMLGSFKAHTHEPVDRVVLSLKEAGLPEPPSGPSEEDLNKAV